MRHGRPLSHSQLLSLAMSAASSAALAPVFPLSIMVIGWAIYSINRATKVNALIAPFNQAFLAADNRWQQALGSWEARCGVSAIWLKKDELRRARDDYLAITAAETRRIEEYKLNRRTLPLTAFLDRYRIKDTKISGVGPAKLATLASYGVETASNVTRERLLNVPGFGPITSRPLLAWRSDLEKHFIFNAQLTQADKTEIARIKSEAAVKAHGLQTALTSGAAELQRLKQAFDRMTSGPDPLLDRLNTNSQQLIVDFAHLRTPTPATPQRVRPTVPPIRTTPRPTPTVYAHTHTTTQRTQATAQPNCPTCGSPMLVRRARQGRHAGSKFWGCSTYPRCKGTRRI